MPRYFNPRLRKGGDIYAVLYDAADGTFFNPRLQEGGDVLHIANLPLTLAFQSTPPRRRRPSSHILIIYSNKFQSTPPRRRRRIGFCIPLLHFQISIHASEKETTATYCDTSAIMYISSLNNFFVHYF